jgi:sugar lactone lactonase YvrE
VWDPVGSLYVLGSNGICEPRLAGLRCSNGLGWSPDGRIMYVTDSTVGTIWVFDFDGLNGALSAQRVFAQWPISEGVPDGLAVDEDGHVWTAVWDGWSIRRYTPSGRLVETVPMPVQRPTSCALGGARHPLCNVGLVDAHATLDGTLFAFEPGVKGLPIPRCGLPTRNTPP